MTRRVDVAVIGAGTAANFALAELRRQEADFVLINSGPVGTTCARVGCMPSKVAIRIGEDFHTRHALAREGITGGDGLTLDPDRAMARVREMRDGFVRKVLSRSIERLADHEFLDGHAAFQGPNTLSVGDETVEAERIIIATGSTPVVPGPWRALGGRVHTTDDLFEAARVPRSLAVVGLGAIGLELGQALARWGVAVTGVDQLETVAGLADPAARDAALAALREDLPVHLGSAAELSEAGDGLRVRAGDATADVEAVLAAMGRRPATDGLHLERLGVTLDARGLPPFDPETLQVGDLPVFIAGDVTGRRQVLHEAADEGRMAGHNALQARPQRFRRKTPLNLVFTDPEIAVVGTPWEQLPADAAVGTFHMAGAGRAVVMGRTHGVLRVYGDGRDGRLLGATLVGAGAEHLGHHMAWAIEQGLTVFDVVRMPFYHPVVEEALQNALMDLAGRVEEPPAGPWALTRRSV